MLKLIINSYYKYLNKIEVKVQPSCLITIWRWKPSTLFEAIKICFIPPNLKLKFLHRQPYNFQHQEHCQCLSSPVSHRTITFSTCAPPPTWKPHLLLLIVRTREQVHRGGAMWIHQRWNRVRQLQWVANHVSYKNGLSFLMAKTRCKWWRVQN